MEKDVDFYIKHIPFLIENSYKDCINEVSVLVDDLLVEQRILCLSSLIGAKKLPSFFPPRKPDFIAFISQKIRITECITAQQMHFMTKFYEFLIQNPKKLVKITGAAFRDFDRPTFIYFTYSVIPSIFGFFSSAEHLDFAYQFYTELILCAPKKLIDLVLTPFLQASPSFSFLESIFEEICFFFCHDIRLLRDKKYDDVLEYHAKMIIKSVIKNLRLLPITHLNILTLLQQHSWSQEDVYSLIIRSMVIPQIRVMLKASHFSEKLNVFNDVCLLSIKLFPSCAEPFCLTQTSSIFEVPGCFQTFNRKFLRCITTTRDAYTLFQLAKKVITIPSLILRLGEVDGTGFVLFFRPIIIKVYPQNIMMPRSNIIFKNIIFTEEPIQHETETNIEFDRKYSSIGIMAMKESKYPIEVIREIGQTSEQFNQYALVKQYDALYEKSQIFEVNLKLRFVLNQIKKWKESIDKLLSATVVNFSQIYIQEYFEKNEPHGGLVLGFSPASVLESVAPILNSKLSRILFLTTRAEMLIRKWLKPEMRKEIRLLKSLWKEQKETEYQSLELPSCFTEDGERKNKRLLLNQYYLRISLCFESMTLVPFCKQFKYIVDTVDYIRNLSDMLKLGDELLMHSLKICSNNDIIVLVLYISSTLTNYKPFNDIISKPEKSSWSYIEDVVMRMALGSEKLMLKYNELKESLSKKLVEY